MIKLNTELWKYSPKLGDAVETILTKDTTRRILGVVVSVDSDMCRIVTNPGTDIQGDFHLNLKEWRFRFLHNYNHSYVKNIIKGMWKE